MDQISHLAKQIEESIPRQLQRWGRPEIEFWKNEIDVMLEFAKERPEYVRTHIIENFDMVEGTGLLTIRGLEETTGQVSIESIPVASTTDGILIENSTWTGQFFADIPLCISFEGVTVDKVILTALHEDSFSYSIVSPNQIQLLMSNDAHVTMTLNNL